MKSLPFVRCGWAAVLATMPALLAQAQSPAPTPREQAVAIDKRVALPVESVNVELLAGGLRHPWSLAFGPSGDMLIAEKHVGIRVLRRDGLDAQVLVGGPSDVLAVEDSGVLDIALDPGIALDPWIYVAFAEGTLNSNRTAIWKARYDGRRLTEGRVIFRSRPDKAGSSHPGGRLLFLPDKTLLLTVGDGFDYKSAAQDLGSHLGKTLRLTRDGRAATDNPWVARAGALPEIWTAGHRNAQGLARDPLSGEIWLHEHGPRGGDEVNLLVAGANFGWPVVTHGIDYDGHIISERAHGAGFEGSRFYWAPSIAPSGLVAYRGAAFPEWQGQLLVGGLASRSISRLRKGKQTGLFVEDERLLTSFHRRIRDLREGPDGLIYVLTDDENGELLRLRPTESVQH